MKQYSISIIIPVYNEELNLKQYVKKIDSFLTKHFSNFEIIIIESGSSDNSLQICKSLASKNQRIKLIHQNQRKGFGSALRLGFKKAGKDLVWVVPVDMPFRLDTVLKAITMLEKYDCILSFRSKDPRKGVRKLQAYFYNTLIKFCLGLRVKHTNSAFKLFKRTALQKIRLISTGWFIDAEIIYRLQQKKIKFTQIPVELKLRKLGKSSVSPFAPFIVLGEIIRFSFMNLHN